MRSVILAALLVVACNGLANFMPLSGVTITNPKLTVTGAADNTAAWDIVGVVSQTGDYNADGAHSFNLMFNVTYSGTIPAGALSYWMAVLTVSGPGSSPSSNAGGTCNSPGVPSGAVALLSPLTQIDGHIQYMGPTAFALTATGAYTGTVTLYTYGVQRDTATFQFNVGTAYVAPTKVTPTFTTFTVGAAANGSASTPNINAVLDAGQINAGDTWSARVTFANGAAPSAVAWGTSASPSTTGTLATWSALSAGVGYWCGNRFVSGLSLSGATFPQNVQINTQSATAIRSLPAPTATNSFTPPAQSFTATSGSTDTTAPACTAAAFAASTITTAPGTSTVGVTTTCTDANLAYSGVFIHGTSQNGHEDDVVFNGNNYNVPLFQTGEANIIGVWAIDQTGNAVVYGDCGDNGATWATMCGGGSSGSSALVASFAVVMMCIAAVLAL